jgi:hypothetical protein
MYVTVQLISPQPQDSRPDTTPRWNVLGGRDNILELQIAFSDQHQTQPNEPKWSETSDTNTSFCNVLLLPRGPPVP